MPSMPLLASFQQLTELGESSQILQDLSRNQGRGPIESQYSHLKDILETWRLRTPNDWERLSTWSDIMLWRNVIYNIVINAFQSVKDVAPHLHQLGYRDRAWSVNRCCYLYPPTFQSGTNLSFPCFMLGGIILPSYLVLPPAQLSNLLFSNFTQRVMHFKARPPGASEVKRKDAQS